MRTRARIMYQASAAAEPAELSIVRAHLATRRIDRRLTLAVTAAVALAIAAMLTNHAGNQVGYPVSPFAFRV